MTASSNSREALIHSIIHYLHRNGFTKTLKRFQSEAQIQDDSWKDSSVNLEDIFDKYIKACQTEDKVMVESETKAKKRKKSKHDSASGDEGKETETEAPKKPIDDSVNDLEGNESKKKPKEKKKKKNKDASASANEVKETESEAAKKPVEDTIKNLEVNESKKKPKEKKKKSKEEELYTKENGEADINAGMEEKKSSKKRKRLSSDENEDQSDKMGTNQTVEEAPKEKKIDENKTHKNEKSEVNEGEKSGPQNSVKKQRTGSAEPRTVNAFQRVKIDQVEFAHEKLQDNSYWAKDGAEIGYGAKAQEVLGQVRGRDFRHEKTKKKRGSYRGGQIDLQSHSIKFNYSDED